MAAKQIRFVHNEGEPPPKRRRITAACKTCRKRKTRCDGTKPLCLTCTDNGHECLGFVDETEGKKSSNDNRHSENYNMAFGVKRMAEPWGVSGRKQENVPSHSRTHQTLEDERVTFMESMNKTVYDENEGADYQDSAVFASGLSSIDREPHVERHRVPYFRYFGPTAIIPGFKQMVVSVREHRRSMGPGSSATARSPGSSRGGSSYGRTPPQSGMDARSPADMPTYDQTDVLPINRLIIHLVETFFTHLGCNYPFLRKNDFIQRVEERSVEPILVDAVCALAARFSDHRLLTAGYGTLYPKSDYGHAFAQRAKAAIVDTFPCPTVAAVQACLLLAYEGFGANQDSALWMYLGCAIRMAEDLGLQKLDGIKHQGQKDPGFHRATNDNSDTSDSISAQEKLEIEQERIDTFWTVFLLDRVIASGTGRTSTLKDQDLELSFPAMTSNQNDGPPDPFPVLIQLIHLNGRVSDILNNIRNVQDVTTQKLEGLVAMEQELTRLYQKLDSRLTFNAVNFQNSVKSGSGTNFILVHFWFHTLIMLLHQPALMHTFEPRILQLLPNSRELSISSAKTIADILAFAELIDPGSFIGNPFTCQPMYVAACAFLSESEAHTASQPPSRNHSPPSSAYQTSTGAGKLNNLRQKHSLLAAAANQNYQRCYKALQQLEVYWAGVRYILVTLDQRAKGIANPETYTQQEYESTKIKPEVVPSWPRKLSQIGSMSPRNRPTDLGRSLRGELSTPVIDPAQAIGWSLTGTTNSPNSNLTFMYANSEHPQPALHQTPTGPSNMVYDPIRQSLPESTPGSTSTSSHQPRDRSYARQPMGPPATHHSPAMSDQVTTSDAEMLLGLQNSSYTPTQTITQFEGNGTSRNDRFDYTNNDGSFYAASPTSHLGLGGVGDVMMESQEIDMSSLGGDMMPWLGEYLPQDILQFFDIGTGPG